MRIVVLGAGAMGCLFGARLSEHHDVVMLCRRDQQIADINAFGVTLHETDGTSHTYKERIRAYRSGDFKESVDLLIILTKTMASREALAQNRHLLGENTLVLSLQNGGGNDEVLAQFVPQQNIYLGTTKHNCTHLGNGIIRHSGAGPTYIGATGSGKAAESIAKVFQEAGFDAEAVSDIQYLIWEKLFVNLSANSFTAIVRAPLGNCISSHSAWFFMERLICEAVDVARALGCDFSYRDVLNTVHATCSRVATGFSSMSQDVIHGRLTEIDCINGFVVSQAKKLNLQTPYNEFVLHLVHAIEASYKTQEMPMRRCPAGTVILREGEESSSLFKIIEGSIKSYSHYGQPNEVYLGQAEAGQVFGEQAALLGKKVLATVVTAKESLIMEISEGNLARFVATHPSDTLAMMKGMALNSSRIKSYFEENAQKEA